MLFRTLLLLFSTLTAVAQKGLTEVPVSINDGWFTAKTISFDKYTTADRKNGIDQPASVSFIKNPIDAFNFQLLCDTCKQANKVQIQALYTPHIAFSDRSLPSVLEHTAENNKFFYIVLQAADSSLGSWEMILRNMTYLDLNENKQAGILRSSLGEFKVTANNHFGIVNSYENIRYEFVFRKKVVAAIIPGKNPRVWLDLNNLKEEQRIVVAAAMAALLLR
ncbi:hypothetical protein [Chitinophaga sancti]|uniref:hypothetical protein n=1 Tax=Chitinophaga sancti TaxID=1004 RepID=UPI003F7B048E